MPRSSLIFAFRNPTHGSREVTVHCDEPAKLVVKAEPLDDSIAYVANPKSGKVMHTDSKF